jgi:hypothetical protein
MKNEILSLVLLVGLYFYLNNNNTNNSNKNINENFEDVIGANFEIF